MKTTIYYGAWIGDKHVEMTRLQWLTAMRLNFPEPTEEVKKLIRKTRMSASKMPMYHPLESTDWQVPAVNAYYHANSTRKWWYVTIESKTTATCHAVVKYCRKFGLDYSFMNWRDEYEKGSRLDPSYVPEKKDFSALIDELTDINYHSEATAFIDLIEKHGIDKRGNEWI